MAEKATKSESNPKNSLELMLSILLAIATGFSLEMVVNRVGDNFQWIFLSIGVICLVIFIILEMMDIKNLESKDKWKITVLGMLVFFPFTLARLYPLATAATTGFKWNGTMELVYVGLMGLATIIWGKKEEDKKYLWFAGAIIIILAIGLWVFTK